MERESIVKDKSFDFALKIIDLYFQLKNDHEYVLSKQVLRSGTSIGANIEEALAGYSDRDFGAKMGIPGHQARDTRYWLRLINASPHFTVDVSDHLKHNEELIRILTAIVKTTQSKINKK